ncbi:argonaute/piwi family protein [Burkholderia pseudomallei]|uniref:argonaute/piwi family protein n=1 Tax=Burkholderia pseudomallei TaxID=28450 RepID=UPI0022D00027|nr:hypothetical protein [Burkholderia pseudomallei]MDA0558319.1 hypothetical protein [Burkholderia pseudomallei]
MTTKLEFFAEPRLRFGYGQHHESPKDGLFLFGPYETAPMQTLRIGAIGSSDGLARLRRWLDSVRSVIPAKDDPSPQHRIFPGFGAVFGADLPARPVAEIDVSESELRHALFDTDRHQGMFAAVDVFAKEIVRYRRESESPVDMWFVVLPEYVYMYGRPQSTIPKTDRIAVERFVDKKLASSLASTPSLFEEDNASAIPYQYELNFHNQLKARLLEHGDIVIQILRETTIAPNDFLRRDGRPMRGTQDPATLAWNLSVTTYYKFGKRPWRLEHIREGVCYIGLVFKRLAESSDTQLACCGAQMFLSSGDGVVFRGAIGPWRSPATKEFHLSRTAARDLVLMVVDAYKRSHEKAPNEVLIHGLTHFNDEEWAGFQEALPQGTSLVGVRIRESGEFKLYRPGSRPVLRGTALLQTSRSGFLWTRGYIPFLKTYMGRESPIALKIDILRGDADLRQVMEDVMGLTKLNFNSCTYADGLPVTLRFANMVGEILTAGPEQERTAPLPFKHYI